MLNVCNVYDYTHVEKSWGYELWLVNNNEYCGKELYFDKPGARTSLHYHVEKRETMYCRNGIFVIAFLTKDGQLDKVKLDPRQSVEIPRECVHSIICIKPGMLMEFSTTHKDEDSYRVSGEGWLKADLKNFNIEI